MLSKALKKIRDAKRESRLEMYRAYDAFIPREKVRPDGQKILSIVDQTLADETYRNYAGHISNDITIVLRVNDETAFRSSLAKLKLLQQEGNNYGDMSNEEIALHIKPRDVQTLAEYDRWQRALAEHDFDNLSRLIPESLVEPVEPTPVEPKTE